MGKVQLKLPLWVGVAADESSASWTNLEREIGEDTTVGDFLTDLAGSYPNFRKMIFNPDAGKAFDQVNVVLNDSLLQLPDFTETRLNDGDSIVILPVYAGG